MQPVSSSAGLPCKKSLCTLWHAICVFNVPAEQEPRKAKMKEVQGFRVSGFMVFGPTPYINIHP